ncbi:hypothetical protein [Acidisphaera rubrifaciens]|uniref:Uncharacterized protein n=1 Tax=Acidisphaera rubrifaciens HS-AP3 TaxID=1231350 RepID=A0A0D6P7I7_9PROT|nr:hypothetical protein [Acidisphaera rubrifaciens]GAN77725.1 hypothetical protein Asru_0429_02 [Acidisphaera rubrifaciens HS-AP3]
MTDDPDADAMKAVLACFAYPVQALAILRRHLGDDAPADVVAMLEAWATEGTTPH